MVMPRRVPSAASMWSVPVDRVAIRPSCGSRSITPAVTWVATNGTRIRTGPLLAVTSGPAARMTLIPSAYSWLARYPVSPGLASVSVIIATVTAVPSPWSNRGPQCQRRLRASRVRVPSRGRRGA